MVCLFMYFFFFRDQSTDVSKLNSVSPLVKVATSMISCCGHVFALIIRRSPHPQWFVYLRSLPCPFRVCVYTYAFFDDSLRGKNVDRHKAKIMFVRRCAWQYNTPDCMQRVWTLDRWFWLVFMNCVCSLPVNAYCVSFYFCCDLRVNVSPNETYYCSYSFYCPG